MQMVILAGGLATRLRPLSDERPKSMILFGGKPFLWHQLELLKKHDIRNVVLCVGYLACQIEDYFKSGREMGMEIAYSHEKELRGTAGALRNALPRLEDEFFVMNGDSYLMLDFKKIKEYFRENGGTSLMVVYKNNNRYDKSNAVVKHGFVKRYDREKQRSEMVYVDAGLYCFKKKVIRLIPDHRKIQLDEIFSRLALRNELLAYETTQRFYEVGSIGGVKDFEQLVGGRA